MIKIEKAESYRICSHCYSKNDVMNINIRYQCTNTGTQITLCKECCESMVNEIRRVDLNPKAAAVKDEDDTERRAPSAQPEYEPVKAEDFAKTMSENTRYNFMAWHGEALELMERQGFVICKKTM